jgi:hypothetical protein
MSLRHPITGALSNPEWDQVRDRWNERHCNAVMAASRPAPKPRRYPINLIKACLALAAGFVVIAALWMKL